LLKKDIDVEQLMEEVNRAVAAPDTLLADLWKEERPKAPNLSFLYPPYSKSLQVNLDAVSRSWEIKSDFELGSKRRAVGGLAVAFKRVIRAGLSWYINPIVHQVRKFNMLVTRTLHDIGNNLGEMSDRVKALEERMERIEKGEGG
jgi:hypothetical protein